jgi:hypothetical protein
VALLIECGTHSAWIYLYANNANNMTPIKQVVWCSWLYTNNMTNNISCIYTKFRQQTTHPSNYQSKFFLWIDIHYKAPSIARASFEFFWVHTFGFAKHQKNYNIENTHTHTHLASQDIDKIAT